MSNKEILEKAIKKAYPPIKGVCQCEELLNTLDDLFEFDHAGGFNYYCLIFSHNFAEHFWGKEEKDLIFTSEMRKSSNEEIKIGKIKVWEYHLQQLVLEKDKFKYLEKFLT